ncbi:MAG: hypothetical protein LBS30_06575, partial [Planctomycetota bacterium]|nr:hypothetical protein [Planctomycetota bacterium]
MRIKCPNSDIILELPGDKTDMKFTCPACHKVHRVTVSITTPGEEPPSPPQPNTRTMARNQPPPMPKKYATGAYAPVVDIPIDANFVLLDENIRSFRQGIDLGQAAEPPPPRFGDDFSTRATEVKERPLAEERPASPPPPPAEQPEPRVDAGADETVHTADQPESALFRDETVAPPPLPRDDAPSLQEAPSGAGDDGEDAYASARPRGGAGRAVLFLILLAILAGGGYLGWQQYRFDANKKNADNLLSWADNAWSKGEIQTAAQHAREAEETLRQGDHFLTPGALWNKAAGKTGLFAPLPSPVEDAMRKIREHLDREQSLDEFRQSLTPSSASGMAASLRDNASPAADASLTAAMEKAVVDAAVEELERAAAALTPEAARAKAQADKTALLPALSPDGARDLENRLSSFADAQRRRLAGEVKDAIADIARAASTGEEDALARYRALSRRALDADIPELAGSLAEVADSGDRESLRQLSALSDIVSRAVSSARTILSRSDEGDDDSPIGGFVEQAKKLAAPNAAMADTAVKLIEATRAEADDLLGQRVELFERLQSEMRRERDNPGTRMAWAMLRSAFDDPGMEIDPSGFKYDSTRAAMVFSMNGIPARMDMGGDDYEKRVRAEFAGYTFEGGWALLFHKPLGWMAELAGAMRKAGVDAAAYPRWELLEGPGAPLALSIPGAASSSALGSANTADAGRSVFFGGRLHPVRELPQPAGSREVVEVFLETAKRLEEAVMADESISQPLRQALKPVLMGTYRQPDSRDYFDSAFCRRLVEADYLETYIAPMPAAVSAALAAYREALNKLEAGYDEFSLRLDDGGALFAVSRPGADLSDSKVDRTSDQDPETGETTPRFTWRIERERENETVFFSPQPARFVYAFVLAEQYEGIHKSRPAGVPRLTEVWHIARGRIASYRDGDANADGDADMWNEAIAGDSSGRFDPTIGPPGWNYPLHVLQRDDQGDPVLLATLNGVVASPDFSGKDDPGERRSAEDEWLDHTADVLSSPGELGLIFHQFFRYCSDSPLPELPNLIGSHFGLSDTHQTVYESLERRWVGRLIGDCDDLAEFFQVLTRRQGKLSHVMQLPSHAAAGYVDKLAGEDGYRFVVLQTGPVLQFAAPTLNDVVEMAYRSFDRGEGMSHMTTDAVPILLRFADEETRTPFVLSARIYGDAEYADAMTEVQSYWHKHVYSAALGEMEEMVAGDKEIGNIKELGSLYERVGFYDKSAELRRQELELVRDNPQASLSTLLEIAQLHFQDKNRDKSLEALGEMEDVMRRMIRQDDAQEFFRAMTFRSYWAMYLARLDQPDRAWQLVRYDAAMTKRQLGRIAEPVLQTMAVLYDRMCMMRDSLGGELPGDAGKAMADVRKELEDAFGKGYFKSDDSYNSIINRYFVLGRYAVSDMGREKGLERLRMDGPYPAAPKDHTRRTKGLDDEDWEWFRIAPQLYLAMGTEMLDQDEYPELYDPAAAKPLLEDVARAVSKGTGLGSDVAGGDDLIKSELTLSFLNNDLAAFRAAMRTVKEKDYSSLYDDAAMTFGLHCGLVPLEDFRAWTEAFNEFFPGSQHYFKVVYRAIDKGHYDHALVMAESTARFFPDDELLLREAEFVRSIIPGLKQRRADRQYGM